MHAVVVLQLRVKHHIDLSINDFLLFPLCFDNLIQIVSPSGSVHASDLLLQLVHLALRLSARLRGFFFKHDRFGLLLFLRLLGFLRSLRL